MEAQNSTLTKIHSSAIRFAILFDIVVNVPEQVISFCEIEWSKENTRPSLINVMPDLCMYVCYTVIANISVASMLTE